MHTPTQTKFSKNYHQLCLLALTCAWLGILPSCAGPTNSAAPLPRSAWGEKYAYNYDLSKTELKAPGSIPVNVAVVNPYYKDAESVLTNELFSSVGKGFSTSMGNDLDKILIAKGMTTTGPFPSLDEITYSEKKNAALTLAPRIFVTADIKYDSELQPTARDVGTTMERHFTMNITGWISFIMQEPLSGEKMWIKKLELEPVKVEGVEIYEATAQYRADGCGGSALVGYSPTNKKLYVGQTEAMAGALKKLYPVILSQFEKYLDSEEMVQLKTKGQEIRALKVY
jgi:hypothetical protein